MFFYTASQDIKLTKPILLSAFVALLGLTNINISTDFEQGLTTTLFWLQTFLLALYVGWLFFFYIKTNIEEK